MISGHGWVIMGVVGLLGYALGNFTGYAKGYHDGTFRCWGVTADEDKRWWEMDS